jgi:hypothetical protein
MKGLVQGGEVAIDLVSGRQMRESVSQDGSVFRERQKFNAVKGIEQRGAELIGGTELSGPGGTELFEAEAVETGP